MAERQKPQDKAGRKKRSIPARVWSGLSLAGSYLFVLFASVAIGISKEADTWSSEKDLLRQSEESMLGQSQKGGR
ncbi:hypothetical protein ACTQW9_16150 [Lachnospiraceae bacterium LCP19S3_B12]